MVKLKALMDHIYANKRVKKDEEYEAVAGDAKVLTLMNRSAYVEGQEEEEKPRNKKQRYKRRDLRADA